VPIKILVTEDNAVVRSTIVNMLKTDSTFELVGEAVDFAQTLELVTAVKPDILLLDLHMPDESNYSHEFVKRHFLQPAGCILAISVWNDQDAKALAESFRAKHLLDKTNLCAQVIPSIKLLCQSLSSPRD
jgi:chemotaxis response regulator CheB